MTIDFHQSFLHRSLRHSDPRFYMLLKAIILLGFALLEIILADYNSHCKCKRTLSSENLPYGEVPPIAIADSGLLPDNFDWSNVAGINYLVPSWNQHIPTYCGSCYAHGTLAAVQDRIKVAKGAKAPDVMLSRQSFINCGPSYGFGSGCNGGNPTDIYGFMHDVGLPDETCNNYVAISTDTCALESMCMNCMVTEAGTRGCWPVKNYTKYYVSGFGKLVGEEEIMSEVFHRGPVTCGFMSDDNFDYGYRGGVWQNQAANRNISELNHDVEVTGWGITDDGIKFWQVRNSWGTYWGEGGFFKIERGINLSFFESGCYFAIVDISDEEKLKKGKLVGTQYGLVDKPQDFARQSNDFSRKLESLDWFDQKLKIPSGLPHEAMEQIENLQNTVDTGKHNATGLVLLLVGLILGAFVVLAVQSYWHRKNSRESVPLFHT